MKKICIFVFLLFSNFILGKIEYDKDEIRRNIQKENVNFIKNKILVSVESIEELNDILFMVAEERKIDIMKIVLESGAEINSINSNGDTPLAVYIKSYESGNANERYRATNGVINLIELGADVNAKGFNGETPFLLAIRLDIGEIKWMMDQGANLNVRDNEGNTPFLLAASKRIMYLMEYIFEKNPKTINDVDNKGNNALTIAMLGSDGEERHFYDILDFLINEKPDIVNMKNKDGNTALDCALLEDDDESIGEYYGKGLIDKKSILFKAIDNNASETLETLIGSYRFNDSQAEDGTTPLMYAIQKKNEKAISICVSYNIDVNLKDNKGNTALMYAVMTSSEKIAEYLIKHGANKFIKNSEGKTIFDLADSEEMKKFLKTGERSDEGEIEEIELGMG